MCVIIYREPKVVIPFEKIKSACIVNRDGMGIATVDRGKMELRKIFDGKGNDPDILARYMEQAKDLPMYIHLRYKTKGAIDSSNVHPFGVLKTRKHGIDLQFMHNGTLSDYGTETDCDSKDFVKKLLTPLAEKLMAAVGPEGITKDPTLAEILRKYAGRNSYFMLVDNLGNHQMIADDEGHQHDGWWSSNVYSFNRTHREPAVTYSKGPNYRNSTEYDYNWSKMYGQVSDQAASEKKELISLATVARGATGNDSKEIPFETAKEEAKGVTVTTAVNPTTSLRERFIDVAGLTNLSDVCALSAEDISELVTEYPDKAELLILDLLLELYDRDREYDDLADEERLVA